MKIYFPIHFDGGNRGCEAIAKGTALLLDKPKEESRHDSETQTCGIQGHA